MLTPVTITALLVTLVLLFSFKGEVILSNPLTIVWIAVPLLLQTVLIFVLGYGLSKVVGSDVRERSSDRLDRSFKSLRGSHRDRHDAVRAVFGRGAGHCRGCTD